MFKTIFAKLLAVFISILIISTIITGSILYFFLGDFVSKEKISLLDKTAENITEFLISYVENQENSFAKRISRQLLDFYGNNTNSVILVANQHGDIVILNEQSIPSIVLERLITKAGVYKLPDKRQYEEIMKNPDVNFKSWGDFYGLFKDTNTLWLTIAKPFIYNQKIEGAVFLSTPVPELTAARKDVLKLFSVSVMISIVISIILMYIFSLRFSNPLKQMSKAVRNIAKGDFQERLKVNSDDEIGELAANFNNMAQSLQNLEDMRRGFIANVSHELRTPMTSILGFINGIIDETIPPKKHKKYLEIIKDEVNRLNRLVNEFLDLAKMESGQMVLNLQSFDINELIRISVIKLESIIAQKNLNIKVHFSSEQLYVIADIDAIERVLINLIHNAVKFTNENDDITLITTELKDKVMVFIEDTGVGIDKDELDLIWERFYKSDKSRSIDKNGTGLGLALVKNIINLHGEKVKVESQLGKGTKFYFTLAKEN